MKVIMTGGGTGGHIYPAIAIANTIKKRNMDAEIIFVGTKSGLESSLVPQNGYDIKFIDIISLNRKNMIKNIKVAQKYVKAQRQAKKIIKQFDPDIVIGTGGYVCAPVIKAASSMSIPTYIHEQNAIAGLSNKLLEKSVNNVFLAFEEAKTSFKQPKKHIVTGNPVRDEFLEIENNEARERLGIEQDKFVILSFGGSRGAGKINKAMLDVVRNFSGSEEVEIYFATGSVYYESVLEDLKESDTEIKENIHIIEYIKEMYLYLASADIVIGRSGAITVSEIGVCGTPSILIPSPNVTGNHQMYNAKVLADKGAAVILEEKDLSGNALIDKINELKADEEKLASMSKIAKENTQRDASDIIYYNVCN